MSGFEFTALELHGAYLITAFHAGDERGGFTKWFEKDIYAGGQISFQLNETFSSRSMKNVVRGLHFQLKRPQAKLVSVVAGRVWDVIVDLRPGSESFGQWAAAELSAENHTCLYIPRGFAHGFASLEDNTVMLYQCDGAYDRESDTGILFNDPEIGIQWPVPEEDMIRSERDRHLMTLAEYKAHPMEL